MDTLVSELVKAVEGLLGQQTAIERLWVGRRVRLKAPFGALPGKGRVLLPEGRVGVVVKIRLVEEAPLVLRFPGIAFNIAPLPHLLEVLDE
jgi:hypothetical protein